MSRQTTKSRAMFVSVVATVLGGLIVVSGQNPPALTGPQTLPLRESELLAQGKPLPDYDVRGSAAAATPATAAAQQRSTADLRRQVGDATRVQFDARSGGVSQIFQPAGYLTGPQAGAPSAILNGFLVDHAELFGLSSANLSDFITTAEDRDGKTGVTHIYLEQRLSGLRVFGSVLKGHVDGTGRLISVEGHYYPDSTNLTTTAALSAEDALQVALRSSVPDVLAKVLAQQAPATTIPGSALVPVGAAYQFPSLRQAESGPDRLTIFDKGPFASPIAVRQVVFPTAAGALLAWQVEVDVPSHQAYYVQLVDAATGTLLYRTNTYRFAVDSNALVFPKSPEASPPQLKKFSGDPVASPLGWSSGLATLGNNVQGDSATSSGDFSFPFTDAWRTIGANPFDLAGRRLRFTPTDALATGYTVAASPAGSTDAAPANLLPLFTNTDDGAASLACDGWTANVLGATFTSLWINTNGTVSFGAGIVDPFPSKVSFSSDARRIAGLWRDLDPGAGGTLTGDCAPEGEGKRLRFVWSAVPDFLSTNTQTFAIVVHGVNTGLDNVIDLDYGTVTSLSGDLVGVGGNSGIAFSAATAGIVSYRDLSAGAAPDIAGGVAQTFPDPDLNLSITNFTYHLNVMHDYYYRLGFTEAAGNYQLSNLTRGGAALDPVQAEAQYSLNTYNNAFFRLAADGTPGFIGFGLFSSGSCRRDSGLDATVIYHEYTHGVSTRMVGGPQNIATLGSFQGAALGEGWSDAFPLSIFNDPVTGAYVTCNPRGIRSHPYDAHPATYANFGNQNGPIVAGIGSVFYPEPHRDGEIWAATAWDIHTALGSAVTQQLLFDAFRYTPIEPSMVDAKNAVLIADLVDYNGAHLKTLYTTFARRGLGVSAATSPGSYSTAPLSDGFTSTVFAAFDTPSTRYAPEPQSVVFSDAFDSAGGWVVTGSDGLGGTGLWHLSSRRASSGATAFYYGRETTGTYDTGFRNYGALTSPEIQLPALAATQTIALEWDQYRQTADAFVFDGGFVRVLDVAAGTATQVAFASNTRTSTSPTAIGFAHQKVNLQPFAGRLIRIQFYMDTLTPVANTAEGWYVDNVSVSVLGPSGPATTVTSAATGIFSRGAMLNGTGTPNGAQTAAYFEYGLTTSYGSQTGQVNLGSGSAAVAIGGGAIAGLSCATTYHFRAVAINGGGLSVGDDATFTTLAAPCRSIVADVDNDSRSDLVVFRRSTGTWFSALSGSGYRDSDAIRWGESTDIPIGGDFDGDGRTDRAVYRPSAGTWYILKSSTDFTSSFVVQWGDVNDIPLQGDIDGDGRADLIVWRPSTGTFYWLNSSSGYSYANQGFKSWGIQALGDRPMMADMDGDGRSDLVIWRASTGTWFWLTSSSGFDIAAYGGKQWGTEAEGDVPLLGDVDGDHIADLIVWRASLGTWFWLTSSSGYDYAAAGHWGWGRAGDIPMLGDFDADGLADLTVWRPGDGIWYWLTSSSGYDYAASGAKSWGSAALGDVPVIK